MKAACKESHAPQPGASGFCNRASESCSYIALRASEVFEKIQITEEL